MSFARAFISALLIALAATLPLVARSQTAGKGTEPAWVRPLPLPGAVGAAVDAQRARVAQGNFYHLLDSQTRWVGDAREDYVRTAVEVTDRAGLEAAATVSASFDPESESLTLTRLDILRDGQRQSLIDRVNWDVFRRERRLEAGIIDGTLTAVLQVPGLRVGDILDYSLVRRASAIYPGALHTARRQLEWNEPVILARHVALWPADRPFVLAPLSPRIEHSVKPDGAVVRHEFVRRNNLPEPREGETPPEDDPDAEVQYSDTATWDALVAALGPHYWAAYPLPADWEKRLVALRSANPTAEARALAALRLVQDEVRYVSLSVGNGGYLARSPAEVLTSGFGDCKDKSLLLVTLLGRMGIAASVALTDLDRGYELPSLLPQLGNFDHMIARIDIDGQSYWVDPTKSHQGGSLADNVVPDVGFALPLIAGQVKLQTVPASRAMAWNVEVAESFYFNLLGFELAVQSRYAGAAADYWRYQLATSGAATIGDNFLGFYGRRYPGIRLRASLEIGDDRAANVLTMRESYDMPAAVLQQADFARSFLFGAEDLTQSLREAVRPDRRTPLLIGPERLHRHEVSVLNAPINFEPPQDVKIRNDAFAFSYRGRAENPGGIALEWTFHTRARRVGAAVATTVARDARRAHENSGFTWDLSFLPPANNR